MYMINSLLRAEVDNELPERLSSRFGKHVPNRIGDCGRSKGDDSLLRT
jgi:hypothetical protein